MDLVFNRRIQKLVQSSEQIIERPFLLDIPIAILAGKTYENFEKYFISALDLIRNFVKLFNTLEDEIPSVICLIQQTLKKYETPDFPELHFLSELQNNLTKFRTNHPCLFLKKGSNLDHYFSNDLNFHALGYSLDHLLGNKITKPLTSAATYFFRDYTDKIAELKNKQSNLPSDASAQQKAEIQILIQFYQELSSCFYIIEGLLYSTFHSCLGSWTNLINYRDSLPSKKKDIFLKSLQLATPPLFKELKDFFDRINRGQIQEDEEIDDLVNFIEGGNSKNVPSSNTQASKSKNERRSNQRKSGINQPSTQSNSPQLKTPSEGLKSVDHPDLPSLTDNKQGHQLAVLLARMCKETRNPDTKECLRHAHMYLEDAMTAQKRLEKNDLKDNSRRFLILSVLQSIYFCLEALLHFEKKVHRSESTISGSGHNLRVLFELSGIKSKMPKLIHDIFLANYWLRNPYEQRQFWSQWGGHETINDIISIYEANNLHPIQPTITKILNYFPKAMQVIRELPSIKKAKKSMRVSSSIPPTKFTLVTHFPIKEFAEIKKICVEIIDQIPSFLQPELKQIQLQLSLIEGILEEFEKGV